jgi:hypothetical protein
MVLRWSEEDSPVYIVPRLEDELIDDLFYQEDEIGEMRHSAFMIECGLEEDPPDGPDVPPIPWKLEDLKKAAHEALKKEEAASEPLPKPQSPKKDIPKRTYSMDEGLEDLEEHLPLAAKKEEPRRRKIQASKSGSLHGMRRAGAPNRCMSFDTYGKSGEQTLSVAMARTEKKRVGPRVGPRKLNATKSGSLLEMRKNLEGLDEEEAQPSSPRRASKLIATKSGNLHGMRRPPEGKGKEGGSPTKKEFTRTSLTVTKSGTKHGLRKAKQEDIKDAKSVDSGSTSDSFLSDIESESHGSDVSIETDISSEDEPKAKMKNGELAPAKILKDTEKDKEKKKKKKSSKDKEKKSPKKKKSSKDKDKVEKEKDSDEKVKEARKSLKKSTSKSPKKSSSKSPKKFEVKKANPEDLPPAFRSVADAFANI